MSDKTNAAAGAPKADEAVLAEIVSRIVEVVHPDRIILFGSAARGEMGPDSDLDLLVIKADVEHRRRLAQQIYLNLIGITTPVDVIVLTPEDIEQCRDKVGTIIGPALREGREIYAAEDT
jgi:predicted nucleotidyltransferase